MINPYKATRKELMALPERAWDKPERYDTILLFPSKRKHDSGFARMVIIGCRDGMAVEIAVSSPDDLNWHVPNMHDYGTFTLANLKTDCYLKNGGLQFWAHGKQFLFTCELSSTDIYIVPKEKSE